MNNTFPLYIWIYGDLMKLLLLSALEFIKMTTSNALQQMMEM